jgi:hypothetical protein
MCPPSAPVTHDDSGYSIAFRQTGAALGKRA